ncbi:arylsulfatase [Reichenbachiella versicolor]|uniref:arylsulfatase n=1 Tax=Reichenbachiella versicolor TaxID=1821036 RepID=UPI000D6E9F0B|nr:arylsulfatase [Reichenbachiella versicolor]
MKVTGITNNAIQIRIALVLLVFVISSCLPSIEKNTTPNVILIVTDDQGYGDLSCHGNPYINTPNIDRLYEESVRFTDFHVDPTCAPTRAALMTGKYSHHVGVWHTVCGGNYLRASERTMADIFKSAGYRTALFGKWHLGANHPYRPMDRGFDEWIGNGDGGTGTTDDWFDNDRVNDTYWHNGVREKIDGYAPDVFYGKAIDFIKSSESDKPFFVYLPSYLPHSPHTLPDSTLADEYSSISKYSAFFFAGIERIDQNIGKLREALDESGIADNTIIIFMSDNGGTAGVKLYNAGMRGAKGSPYDGGHRVPFFFHWKGGKVAHGMDVKDLTAHIDVLPTLAEICDLKLDYNIDGRSFREQLLNPSKELSVRTLFVERQRTFIAKAWNFTVGMTNRWRLVNNNELYDISVDPGQKTNVIDQFPDVVNLIRKDHEKYWQVVTKDDRVPAASSLGHPNDPEIFLTSSDWYLPKVPWNHAQVASGSPLAGEWNIKVLQKGNYQVELRRWPREANATIQGIPTFSKEVDAYDLNGGVERLIYGSKMKALPVFSAKLKIGEIVKTSLVKPEDESVKFNFLLEEGDQKVKATFLDEAGQVISGGYYVYLRPLMTNIKSNN